MGRRRAPSQAPAAARSFASPRPSPSRRAQPSVAPGEKGEAREADRGTRRRLRQVHEGCETDAPAEPGDDETGQDQGQRQGVGKDELALVDQGECQERPADGRRRPRRRWRKEPEGGDGDGEGGTLDERVPEADRRTAVTAATAERHPARERHEVEGAQGRGTARAARAPAEPGPPPRAVAPREGPDGAAGHERDQKRRNGRPETLDRRLTSPRRAPGGAPPRRDPMAAPVEPAAARSPAP